MILSKIQFTKSFLAVLLLLLPVTVVRAADTTVSVGNAPLAVRKGEIAAAPVTITEVDGLYGFEVQLKFDPAVVQVADVDPTKAGLQLLPGDFLALDFLVRNTADNDAGVLEFVLTQLNPSQAKSGSGTLFTIYFEGVAEGRTTLVSFDRLKLANRDGIEIPATFVNGEIRVAAASGVTPAASPTPLPTAAQPLLDMDVLTATPPPTLLPTATEPAAVTPTATMPATVSAAVTPSVQVIATPKVGASPSAAPTSTLAPVLQAAAANETPQIMAPLTTTAVAPLKTSTPLVAGTALGSPAATGKNTTTAAPARTGLLLAGGGLIALACAALAGVIVLRRRDVRS